MDILESSQKRRRTFEGAFGADAHNGASSEASTNSAGANANADASTNVIQYEGFEVVNSERGVDAVTEHNAQRRSTVALLKVSLCFQLAK